MTTIATAIAINDPPVANATDKWFVGSSLAEKTTNIFIMSYVIHESKLWKACYFYIYRSVQTREIQRVG